MSNKELIRSAFMSGRPWNSADAEPDESISRFAGRYKETDQKEIEACLHCPFVSCDGNGRICRTFRLHYIAKLEGRE